MKDPYRTLNVRRDADAETIKKAYRKLAKELHPDRNPGRPQAEQHFKEVTQAYQLLGDSAKRAQFDRGQIDAEGKPRGPFGFGGFDFGRTGATRGGAEGLFEKMFSGAFGRAEGSRFEGAFGGQNAGAAFEELLRGHRAGGPRAQPRGRHRRYRVSIDFMTAARGGRRRLKLVTGESVEVDVPPGTDDGAVLRLDGRGDAGRQGAPNGDALVEIAVRSHRRFSKRGDDVHLELPISLAEAVRGARVRVPTVAGPVQLEVPPKSNSGRILRLKNKGIAKPDGSRGDQYVKLQVVLPRPPDPELDAFLERWAEDRDDDVRADLERE